MLMVDDLISISSTNVETIFTIRKDCIFVESNQLTESGLIENAAQTSSTIVGQDFFHNEETKNKNVIGFISTIKTITIHSLPNVNDTISTESKLISKFDSDNYTICTLDCTISNKNIIIANFTMNLFIQEV